MSALAGHGERFAERLLSTDWSFVVLRICALRKWKVAALARHLGAGEMHLQRIARGEVQEPRNFRLAFRLLDEYQDAQREAA